MAILTRQERKERKRAGMCVGPRCDQPAELGRIQCRQCQDADNASIRRHKASLVASGLCVESCGQPAAAGRRRCAKCLEAHAICLRAMQRARGRAGLCKDCGAVAEKTRCPACLAKSNARTNQRSQQLRSQGLCQRCTAPADGYTLCPPCRAHYNIQQRAYKRVKRFAAV
jgi:hypothetical protein